MTDEKKTLECYTCKYADDDEENVVTLCTKSDERLCIDWVYLSRKGRSQKCPLIKENFKSLN